MYYVCYINIHKWWEEELYNLITIFLEGEIQFLKIEVLIMLVFILSGANFKRFVLEMSVDSGMVEMVEISVDSGMVFQIKNGVSS